MANAKSNANFEDTLSELEMIVQQLEVGDLSLEESLTAF
jgi:exodeoxyribonuclease VII small subunit